MKHENSDNCAEAFPKSEKIMVEDVAGIKKESENNELEPATTVIKIEETEIKLEDDYYNHEEANLKIEFKSEQTDAENEHAVVPEKVLLNDFGKYSLTDGNEIGIISDGLEQSMETKDFKYLCSMESPSKPDLQNHLLVTTSECLEPDTTVKKYKCQICAYETCRKYNLEMHLKRHNNIRNFKCTLCSKRFFGKNVLDRHLVSVHKSKDNVSRKIYKCDHCDYENTMKCAMSQHTLIHTKQVEKVEKYKCQLCTYKTCYKKELMKHMKSHGAIRKFRCTYCSKGFRHNRSLENHLLKIHQYRDNVKRTIYECENCKYATTKEREMLQHNLKHDLENGIRDISKILKCQHCVYETYDKKCYNRHVKRKGHLDYHLISVHKLNTN